MSLVLGADSQTGAGHRKLDHEDGKEDDHVDEQGHLQRKPQSTIHEGARGWDRRGVRRGQGRLLTWWCLMAPKRPATAMKSKKTPLATMPPTMPRLVTMLDVLP